MDVGSHALRLAAEPVPQSCDHRMESLPWQSVDAEAVGHRGLLVAVAELPAGILLPYHTFGDQYVLGDVLLQCRRPIFGTNLRCTLHSCSVRNSWFH